MAEDIGLRGKLLVKDVMSSPVATISEEAKVNTAAELMDKTNYGCLIVTSQEGKPLGIITERDLVVRVLSKNLKPDEVKAKDVMTAPLITIEPDVTINEAARRMSRLNIRRLGVLYRGRIEGLLSSKDILGVMPELIEMIQERANIEGEVRTLRATRERSPLAGYCDRCGRWSDDLKQQNGDYICEECRVDLDVEEE